MDSSDNVTEAATTDETPTSVWQHFAALCAIPRVSRNEAQAREYVLGVASAFGAESLVDAKGNVVVRVAATEGYDTTDAAKGVVVQSHLDMVPDIADGVTHDFATDPITTRREGEWMTTGGRTTLGADNGVGAALALALLTEPGVAHGPLELLFTVEEEIGLLGALALDPALVQSRRMINLDNEEPSEILVGCAGGAGIEITLEPRVEAVAGETAGYSLSVTGLLGGHSGIEIGNHRANAVKVLGRLLDALTAAGIDFRLATLNSGTVANKIPSSGQAVVVTAAGEADVLSAIAAGECAVRAEFGADEPDLKIAVEATTVSASVLTPTESVRVARLIAELPHGAQTRSTAYNAVETSCNLAVARVGIDTSGAGSAEFRISCRSLITAEIRHLQERISAIADSHGAASHLSEGYPGWEPRGDSPLLVTARATYEKSYGVAPTVTVIHAGAECGTIISRVPGLDAIAIGPLIENAHTPRERVNMPSVAALWTFLTGLLKELATE